MPHFRAAAIDSVIGDFFDDSKSGILSCFLLCGTLQLSDKGGGSAFLVSAGGQPEHPAAGKGARQQPVCAQCAWNQPDGGRKNPVRICGKGYSAFLAGEKRMLQMQNLECGEITIGASDMTLRFFLLPYLERFHEKYPGVRFQITNGPTPATMGLLKEKRSILESYPVLWKSRRAST